MDKFIIEGGGKLYGRTEIQAAKIPYCRFSPHLF